MTVSQNTTPHYLETKGAAMRTNMSVGFFEKARVLGTGPRFAKLGGRVVYKIEDLDSWVESRMVNSTSEADQLPNISTDSRSRKSTGTALTNQTAPPTRRRGRPPKVAAHQQAKG